MQIRPFQIDIPQPVLDDLHRRLELTRWPDAIPGSGWDYGVDPAYLQELVRYWRDDFDWRAQERLLNDFAQYRAVIGGLGIHFIHEPGKGPDPIPLLITHGWPSSVSEMLKLIRRLTDPASFGGDAADSFTVIVPSVPGFGFSDIPLARGMSRSKVAELWAELMRGLGYARYGAHCNDIGSVITAFLALDHPQELIGMHTLMPNFPMPAFSQDEPPMSAAERAFLDYLAEWDKEEGGYNLIQETRPQTLGYALNDSPVGLAAWILDKWWSWGALGGNLEEHFSRDELLTNITIYWVTQTANSAGRSYYERAHTDRPFPSGEKITVPVGAALTLEPGQRGPREWAARTYVDIRRWTEWPLGGHFMALEQPDLLAEDIRAFFRPLR